MFKQGVRKLKFAGRIACNIQLLVENVECAKIELGCTTGQQLNVENINPYKSETVHRVSSVIVGPTKSGLLAVG